MGSLRKEKLYEYNILRDEIMYLMKLHKILTFFLFTAVGAYLPVVLKMEQPHYILLIYAILFPTTQKIFYYREDMVKISAYMIVFLEPCLKGVNWETINYTLKKDLSTNHNFNIGKLIYCEYFLMHFSISTVYLLEYIEKTEKTEFEITIFISFLLFFLLYTESLWRQLQKDTDIDRIREKWIQRYQKEKIRGIMLTT